jgi:hypothetical protein
MKNDPGECAGAKPRIEPFEPLEFLHHVLGYPELAACRAHLVGGGHQAEHAVLGKPALEVADRVWMRPGFLRPLCHGVVRIEEQRADECIPLLRQVAERQLGGVRLRIRSHYGSLPAGAPSLARAGATAHGTADAAPPYGTPHRRRRGAGRRQKH